MERQVETEWLDELPVNDPGAMGSRRDLRRLNAWMGNAGIIAGRLQRMFASAKPRLLVEIGAGEGTFLLQVARRLGRGWQGTRALLVDQQPVSLEQIGGGFDRLGWQVQALQADVLDWMSESVEAARGAMIANLFLHHFMEAQLAQLFARIAKRTGAFVAVEPRRSPWALSASRLVWLIGCNRVTRHDAPVSVRAGFSGRELSGLWPEAGAWSLHEGCAGMFSHLFEAHQRSRK